MEKLIVKKSKKLDKRKLTFKIKHIFSRECFDDDDYIAVLYDLIAFISDIIERDANKEKFIKEFKNKYFEILND